MKQLQNPWRGKGLPSTNGMAEGSVSHDVATAEALYVRCPIAHETALISAETLARDLGVVAFDIKDERGRLGLGSFKSLGAAYAIARRAAATGKDDLSKALKGETFICASAGNHGLSMAAGAALFGAQAVVYLSDTVPESFALRLRDKGADVVRAGENYEMSMAAAMQRAADENWHLLSDSTWAGYSDPARDVMEGYLIMGAEVGRQIAEPPTHIFLQAGVGGLAAACTAAARGIWGSAPEIVIVEPDLAPAFFESIRAGKPVVTEGAVSAMGRLDCKEPSHLALKYLAEEADRFMLVSEDECADAVGWLNDHGIATSPSGGAGVAGARLFGPPSGARVLAYVTEGA